MKNKRMKYLKTNLLIEKKIGNRLTSMQLLAKAI